MVQISKSNIITDVSLQTLGNKLYNKHKKELKESVIKSVKRTIINIVKDNSLHNIKMIDKTIIDLLKIDETFRNELIKTRQLSL